MHPRRGRINAGGCPCVKCARGRGKEYRKPSRRSERRAGEGEVVAGRAFQHGMSSGMRQRPAAISAPPHRWLRAQVARILEPLNEGEAPLPA